MKNAKQKLTEDNSRRTLEYKAAMRNMKKYEQTLRNISQKQEAAAIRYENSGHHANAVECARTIHRMNSMADKMHSMQEKLEMVFTMRGIGNALSSFTELCNGMMDAVSSASSADSILQAAATMERADLEMQAMMDSFDIPTGMNEETVYDEEDEACLNELVKAGQKKNLNRLKDITEKMLGNKV